MTVLAPIILLLLALAAFVSKSGSELRDFNKEATIPLRGWLALAVVVGHVDTAMGCPISFFRHFHWEASAVAVFFFMSGYGYARSVTEKSSAYIKGFFRRTCWKLFLPFSVCTLISLLLIGMPINVSYIKYGEIPFLLHAWFVFELIIMSLIFVVSYRTTGNLRSCFFLITLWSLTAIMYVCFRYILNWPQWWYNSLGAFPFGVTFYLIEPIIRHKLQNPAKRYWGYVLAIMVWMVSVAIAAMVASDTPFLRDIPRMFLGAAIVLILYVFQLKCGTFIGKIAYEVYLSHGIFEVLLLRMQLSPVLYASCVLLCTLMFSWVVNRFVAKINQMSCFYPVRT